MVPSEAKRITNMMEMSQTIRAFILYDENLSLKPYHPQAVTTGLNSNLDVLKRVLEFMKSHPEVSNQYGWMLKMSCRNVLAQLNDPALSVEERKMAGRYLKDGLSELPEPELMIPKDLLTDLFLKTGMNLFPALQAVKTCGKKFSMKAMSAYFEKRDRERNSSAAPAKPGTKA